MRIYISGPITNVEDYEEKFEKAATALRSNGYKDIVNPAELAKVLPEGEYDEYMEICLKLLEGCDRMVMLPGWELSRGCNIEYGFVKGYQAAGAEIIAQPIEIFLTRHKL